MNEPNFENWSGTVHASHQPAIGNSGKPIDPARVTPTEARLDDIADSADGHYRDLSEEAERRIADRIDGYDRDDLGESPDY